MTNAVMPEAGHTLNDNQVLANLKKMWETTDVGTISTDFLNSIILRTHTPDTHICRLY